MTSYQGWRDTPAPADWPLAGCDESSRHFIWLVGGSLLSDSQNCKKNILVLEILSVAMLRSSPRNILSPLPAPVSLPTRGKPSPTLFLVLVLIFPSEQILTSLVPISLVTAPLQTFSPWKLQSFPPSLTTRTDSVQVTHWKYFDEKNIFLQNCKIETTIEV